MRRFLVSGLLIATLGFSLPASAAPNRQPVRRDPAVQQQSATTGFFTFFRSLGKRIMGPVRSPVGGCTSTPPASTFTSFGPS
jgi:hypothetical protein